MVQLRLVENTVQFKYLKTLISLNDDITLNVEWLKSKIYKCVVRLSALYNSVCSSSTLKHCFDRT